MNLAPLNPMQTNDCGECIMDLPFSGVAQISCSSPHSSVHSSGRASKSQLDWQAFFQSNRIHCFALFDNKSYRTELKRGESEIRAVEKNNCKI